LPTGGDESTHGDGAAAFVVGDDSDGTVIAEYLGGASVTEEFTDRWRVPGTSTSRQWDERFGEIKYIPLGEQAFNAALKNTELTPGDVSIAIVTGPTLARCEGFRGGSVSRLPTISPRRSVGPAQHTLVCCWPTCSRAPNPNQVIALISLADGADVLLFRTTSAVGAERVTRTVAQQVAQNGPVLYGKFLSWRGMVTVEPPRRPEPSRTSSSAAARSEEWKYGFVGSRDRKSGLVYLPPARISAKNDEIDDMEAVPMADVSAPSPPTRRPPGLFPSPPVVFAVVDFDGGGRLPLELTDVDPDGVSIGMRVEMTFRRLNSADGIHNYFWKGRPVRA
jgi:uncharacterized OB-fold protein